MRKSYIVFIAFILLIVLLAVLPINDKGSALNRIFFIGIRLDHIAHSALFFSWIMLYYLIGSEVFSINYRAWCIVGIILAFITEFMQYFIPYRAFSFKDLTANISGLLLGFISMQLIKVVRKKKDNSSL